MHQHDRSEVGEQNPVSSREERRRRAAQCAAVGAPGTPHCSTDKIRGHQVWQQLPLCHDNVVNRQRGEAWRHDPPASGL